MNMNAPEKSNEKNDLQQYINSLNETIADSQLFMRLMKNYLEEENEQYKNVLLAEMLLSKERAHEALPPFAVKERSENSTNTESGKD
jgi:hypothetical protein